MNILVIILIALATVIGAALIAALFIKKEYFLKKDIIINRPVDEVFNYVRLLRNQDFFSKWVMTDPSMKKNFKGVDGTVGFVYAWEGNKKAGKGEQEIIGIKPNEEIDIEVRFVRPFESTAKTPIYLERISQRQTKITWGMQGASKYPLNLMNPLMGGMLQKDLEVSLNTLKNNLESGDKLNVSEDVSSPFGQNTAG